MTNAPNWVWGLCEAYQERFAKVALASINLNTPDMRTRPTNRVSENPEMRRRVTRTERAAIVRLYESGFSTRAVAEQLDVSKTCVLKILKAEGVRMRPRGESGTFTALAMKRQPGLARNTIGQIIIAGGADIPDWAPTG